jgi:hypothetical protein
MPTPRKTKPSTLPKPQALSSEDACRSAVAYKALQEESKNLSAELGTVKEQLTKFIEANGSSIPNGSIVFESDYAGNKVTLKLEARNSTKHVVDIIDKLKKKLSPEHCKRVIEKVEVLREDVLENLISTGQIKAEVLEGLIEVVQTRAFKVTIK